MLGIGNNFMFQPQMAALRNGASLEFDFTTGSIAPIRGGSLITFARSTNGWRFNNSGVLVQDGPGVPRLAYDPATLTNKGLLIEEQRTNAIRNNSMQGAVAGTPGTLPNTWSGATSQVGLNRQVVGVGVEDGIEYIDIRFSGVPSGNGYIDLTLDSVNATALTGQTWALSSFAKLVAGTLDNTTANIILYGSPSFSDNTSQSIKAGLIAGAALPLRANRFTAVRTFADATTVSASPRFAWTGTVGMPVDFTLRIGGCQLEQGSFATSPIKTNGAAVTRAADIAPISALGPWFNASEGTLLAVGTVFDTSANRFIADITDGTVSNAIATYLSTSTNHLMTTGGVTQGNVFLSNAITANAEFKDAFAYKTNDLSAAINNALIPGDTSANIPVVNRMNIGSRVNGTFWLNGYIKRLAYFPRRLSNAELQAITL